MKKDLTGRTESSKLSSVYRRCSETKKEKI